MMPVPRPAEPERFQKRVRDPGRRWLKKHPTGRARGFWRRATDDLRRAFRDLCGYSAMWEANGEVDHYLSCNHPARPENRRLAYEWSNLRYATAWINRKKGNADESVLDPYEVQEGWFEITPDLRLRVAEACPRDVRERAEYTLQRLGIGEDDHIVNVRIAWMECYAEGLNLRMLEDRAPLLAAAVKKGIVNPEHYQRPSTRD